MKKTIATAMMMLIFVMTLSAQKKYSKEEQNLIGIMQQQYDHWKNKDYEKVAEMWVHEPYVVFQYTSPQIFVESKGWDEVSSPIKNNMNNTPPVEEKDFGQFDYTFLIKENMAMSNFIEGNGVHNSIVFENVKGIWKFVQLNFVDETLYNLARDKKRLGSFEGSWQMIPGSFKWENSDNKMEVTSYEMCISPTLAGVHISEKISARNAQQNITNIVEDISIILNSPSQELIFTSVTSWPNGWTMNLNGKVKVTGESIELDGKGVGNEKDTYTGMIKRESADKINIGWTMPSGDKWSADLKLVESNSLAL